jgi:hypothetical protein
MKNRENTEGVLKAVPSLPPPPFAVSVPILAYYCQIYLTMTA